MTRYSRMTEGGAVLLMDGEVGGGVRKLVQNNDDKKLVPASALLDDPSVVRDLHLEYIWAGAQVITTNTYATVRQRMQDLLASGERWEEAVLTACAMAKQARTAAGKEEDVLIAGSLPPLHGSYRPELVGRADVILRTYREHVALMAEHVDFFLCETMSTGEEGWAAVSAAKESGKPVWVSWTLRDDDSASLRSGETLQQAWAMVAELHPEAALVNCCSPETVTAAMPVLAGLGASLFGGYGNGFTSIPTNWTTHGAGLNALGKRRDLTPEVYAAQAQRWLEAGARIVGGCCEVGSAHILALHRRLALGGGGPLNPPIPEDFEFGSKEDWLAVNATSTSSTSSAPCCNLDSISVSSQASTTSGGAFGNTISQMGLNLSKHFEHGRRLDHRNS